MEIHFTPEQEAHLVQIATATGTDAEWLVRDNGLGETDSGSQVVRLPEE